MLSNEQIVGASVVVCIILIVLANTVDGAKTAMYVAAAVVPLVTIGGLFVLNKITKPTPSSEYSRSFLAPTTSPTTRPTFEDF